MWLAPPCEPPGPSEEAVHRLASDDYGGYVWACRRPRLGDLWVLHFRPGTGSETTCRAFNLTHTILQRDDISLGGRCGIEQRPAHDFAAVVRDQLGVMPPNL